MDLNKIEHNSSRIYLIVCISVVLSVGYYFFLNLGFSGYETYYATLLVLFFTTYFLGVRAMYKAFRYVPKKKKQLKKEVKKTSSKKINASFKKSSVKKSVK